MREELEKKLTMAFPKIFLDKWVPPTESLLCFGFECEDGWYDLIYDLCQKIEKLDPEGFTRAVQVKEKFGGLRFYTTSATDEILDVIETAEDKSEKTCERCGKNGKNRTYGTWLKTLCTKCHNKYVVERESWYPV
jgi:hypothetical protein